MLKTHMKKDGVVSRSDAVVGLGEKLLVPKTQPEKARQIEALCDTLGRS